MENPFNQIASFQIDVLKEVGNIGAGNAATALSKLINKPIDMLIPNVQIMEFEDVSEIFGGSENVVVAIFLRVEGDIPGNMFFILTLDSANGILRNLLNMDNEFKGQYSEIELSALQEIGNILVGSYLSSLADLTKLDLAPTVPAISIDMAGAILSYGLIQFGAMGDRALLINTKFLEGITEVEGHFFFIPDPEAFNKLFQALGVPF